MEYERSKSSVEGCYMKRCCVLLELMLTKIYQAVGKYILHNGNCVAIPNPCGAPYTAKFFITRIVNAYCIYYKASKGQFVPHTDCHAELACLSADRFQHLKQTAILSFQKIFCFNFTCSCRKLCK